MRLNELKDNEGARKSRMRVGRGIGCGKGKTCGRGVKGQKSRTGVRIKGFEGGQMPIYRRLPKRGFNSIGREVLDVVNLGDLQKFVDSGKLDGKKPVTVAMLRESGIVDVHGYGVKLLAKGTLKTKLTVQVNAASKQAVALVEKAGGSVELVARGDVPKAEKAPKEKKTPAKKTADKKPSKK